LPGVQLQVQAGRPLGVVVPKLQIAQGSEAVDADVALESEKKRERKLPFFSIFQSL